MGIRRRRGIVIMISRYMATMRLPNGKWATCLKEAIIPINPSPMEQLRILGFDPEMEVRR